MIPMCPNEVGMKRIGPKFRLHAAETAIYAVLVAREDGMVDRRAVQSCTSRWAVMWVRLLIVVLHTHRVTVGSHACPVMHVMVGRCARWVCASGRAHRGGQSCTLWWAVVRIWLCASWWAVVRIGSVCPVMHVAVGSHARLVVHVMVGGCARRVCASGHAHRGGWSCTSRWAVVRVAVPTSLCMSCWLLGSKGFS